MDKLCSFVEIFHLTERGFYSDAVSPTSSEPSRKLREIFTQLESDRKFNLNQKIMTSPQMILAMFKIYFSKYFRTNQPDETETIRLIKDLKAVEDPSRVLYHVLKRLAVHVNLIVKYSDLNGHTLLEMVLLFEGLMLGRVQTGFSLNFDRYVNNCQTIFGLSDEFFRAQHTMIDKLLSLKSQTQSSSLSVTLRGRYKFANYLVRVYNEEKSPSSSSFQFEIDEKTRTLDVLNKARVEFAWSDLEFARHGLFEVAEDSADSNNKSEPRIERTLPADSILINSLAHWRRFVLVTKANYFLDVPKSDKNFFDSCLSLTLCDKCLM